MSILFKASVTVMVVLVLIAGCGNNEPTATPVSPTATPAPPTNTPLATLTPVPPTRLPDSSAASISLVDSGQRLGSARSWDVSLGDLDADGDLDAFVANGSQSDIASAVWLNDGHGVFTISEQRLGYGVGIELGDLDGDGDLDAFITDWDKASEVWLNDGGVQGGMPGIFADSGQRLGSGGGFDAALGDLDGDGDLDAFVAQEKANTVWLNDGDGTFTDTGQALGVAITAAVALGDLDDDGDLDALAGGWDEPAKVWLNDGTGTFTDSGHDLSPASIHVHGLALGDVDGDSDLDVFLAIASGDPNQVWLNDGGVQGGTLGTFADSGQRLPGSLAHGVSLGDLDGDGDLDAFVTHGDPWHGSSDTVWLNDGGVQGGTLGTFADSGLRLGELASYAVELGDLDNDGDLDVFVAHSDWQETGEGVPNQVWLNETRYPPTAEPSPTATPIPLPPLQTISVENAGQLIELSRLELPKLEDVHETCGVAFGSDGEKLAACCKSANVAVWDVQTGQRIYTLEAPTGICAHVAFSPDGQTLAAGGHRNVIPLWDTSTGALVREIRRATANVSELAFSPIVTGSHAGLRLAVASFIGSALVWDLETDTRLAQFPLHYSRVNSLNFSPDGEMVVSGGGDNLARVWNASSGEQIVALEGPTFYVEDVEFNPEGTQVVGACDDHSIRIWDVSSGDLLHTLWHYGPVNGVTYSPDGKLLASASNDQTVGVWDASSGESLIKLSGHSNLAIATAFRPDVTLIASVSWDGTVRLWGVPAPTGASLPTLGDTWTRSTDGMTMVYVPAGEFLMGTTEAQVDALVSQCTQELKGGHCEEWWWGDESPQHLVVLDGFWIDKYEVTGEQYRQCVETGMCQAPTTCGYGEPTFGETSKASHPVVCVDWEGAQAYCQWAGARLPTEAEWEYAARGPDGSYYPWGDDLDGPRLNYCDANCDAHPWYDLKDGAYDDGYEQTAPVGEYPNGASWCGALDMVGNVWEWVADWYDSYPSVAQTNPTGPVTGDHKAIRGGSWLDAPPVIHAASRYYHALNDRNSYIGFRCVVVGSRE